MSRLTDSAAPVWCNPGMRTPPVLVVAALLLLSACACPCTWLGETAAKPEPAALSVSDFKTAAPGVSIAAQPTDDALRAAAAGGFRTVINLRSDGEARDPAAEGELVASLGMDYVRIPVAKGDVTPEQADRLSAALADAGAAPVLIHCASGQRATAVWTLHLARHGGRTAAEALAEADALGIGPEMRALVERRLRER